jgi:hypothetical protein
VSANKYAGRCVGCATNVAAGEGFYNGNLWCEEPSQGSGDDWTDMWTCSKGRAREIADKKAGEALRAEFYASPEFVAQKAESDAQSAKRAEAEAALNATGRKTCDRCGGAGRSDRWIATGRTCFKCEGVGTLVKGGHL